MKKLFILILLFGITSTANAEIHTETVKYSSDGSQLTGFLAYDDTLKGKRPASLLSMNGGDTMNTLKNGLASSHNWVIPHSLLICMVTASWPTTRKKQVSS